MLLIQKFTFNAFLENTYLLYDEAEKVCAIVDPGCSNNQEQLLLTEFIKERKLEVVHLINTHCHIDHVLGNAFIKRTYGVELALHPADVPVLNFAQTYALQCGIVNYEPTKPDLFLTAGQILTLGKHQFTVLHVPGHSPGHIALYSFADQWCIIGDVLFKNYIGRTDLPGGDQTLLLKSIHEQLFTLTDLTTLYPGHGIHTTIGQEKKYNPFCKLHQANSS